MATETDAKASSSAALGRAMSTASTTSSMVKKSRRKRGSSSSKINALQVMEDVLEKLKVLNYEADFCAKKNRKPLSRTYFALKPQKPDNPSIQLACFLKLVAWLMGLCGKEFIIDKFDDPTTSVNKVMVDLKHLGFELDFPAQKLRQAHGEAVCSVLNFLCDKAFQKRNFSWKGLAPIYPEEDFADDADVDEDADVGMIEDDVAESSEEEVMYSQLVQQERMKKAQAQSGSNEIMQSGISPLRWKTELERVGPKLSKKAKTVTHGEEWRAHLEQTKRHEKRIQETFPGTKQALKSIEKSIQTALQRVVSKEKYINSQFDKMQNEYREQQQKMVEVQERYTTSHESVQELSETLSIISARLEEVKAVRESRGNSMTDTKPLVRIKHAMKVLKAEMVQMEVRIGVVGHTLMQSKMRNKNLDIDADPDHEDFDRDDDDDDDVDDDDVEVEY